MSTLDAAPDPYWTSAGQSSGPRHIGVILDGNRRWASSKGLPVQQIYQAGAAKVPEFLSWCHQARIPVVSLWALSADNLRRNPREVAPLLDIILSRLWDMAAHYPWRLRPIGRLDLLPGAVAGQLREIETTTKTASGLVANIAIAYSGRGDILSAVRDLLVTASPPDYDVDDLERLLTDRLSTAGQPDPDLIIRPSGELRTSGFLLWQAAHAELYFLKTPWPELQENDFVEALASYRNRHRRFGR